MRTITTALACLTMSLLAAGSARAQGTGEATASATAYQPGPLALVAELGWRSGAAVGAELRAGSLGARVTDPMEHPTLLSSLITSFGQDDAGELYILELEGAVYRIVPE